jgi:hypothetical protein
MKLKIHFGSETCFGQPILGLIRTRVPGSPASRISSCALAMTGRPKSIKFELASGRCPENAGS